MAHLSERVTRILRARGLSDEQLGQIVNEARAWRLVYEFDGGAANKRKKSSLPQICFTGFTEATRAPLREIAEAHGYEVKDSVTKGCQVLVTGPNAGPSKIEKAERQGSKILTEEAFRQMIFEREAEVEEATEAA